MPSHGYKAMMISLTLYLLVAPLSTFNTFALLGFVHGLFPLLQVAITIPMIIFAIIAGRSIGKHCLANARCNRIERVLWTIGFYVIGPPILYLYYRRRLIVSPNLTA
ncbi:MAG TPA: hypothetical protein VFD13_08195 [Candidatus Kapabacteria bacterium]|nr:hypothetical protein [Candidatus Kapabacteria bacterium]